MEPTITIATCIVAIATCINVVLHIVYVNLVRKMLLRSNMPEIYLSCIWEKGEKVDEQYKNLGYMISMEIEKYRHWSCL